MNCPRADEVVDHAKDLAAVAGLAEHAEQCPECALVHRILTEVADLRETELPPYLRARTIGAVTALRQQERRARPWELGWAGLLGGLTTATAVVATGKLAQGGAGLLSLAVFSLVVAVVAGWREHRLVEAP